MLPKELQQLIDNMNLPAPVQPKSPQTPTVASMVGDFNKIANTYTPKVDLGPINIPTFQPTPTVGSMISDFNLNAPASFDYNAERRLQDLGYTNSANAQTNLTDLQKPGFLETIQGIGGVIGDKLSEVKSLTPEINIIPQDIQDKVNNFSQSLQIGPTFDPLGSTFNYAVESEKGDRLKKAKEIEDIIGQEKSKANTNTLTQMRGQLGDVSSNIFMNTFGPLDNYNAQQKNEIQRNVINFSATVQNDLTPYTQQSYLKQQELRAQGKNEEADRLRENTDANINDLIKKQAFLAKERQEIMMNGASISEADRLQTQRLISEGYNGVNGYLSDGFRRLDGSTVNGTKEVKGNSIAVPGGYEISFKDGKATGLNQTLSTRKDNFNNQENDLALSSIPLNNSYNIGRKALGYVDKVIGRPLGQVVPAVASEVSSQVLGANVGFGNALADNSDYIGATPLGNDDDLNFPNAYKYAGDLFDVIPEVAWNLRGIRSFAPMQGFNITKNALRVEQGVSRINQLLNLANFKPIGFLDKLDNAKVFTNVLKGAGKTVLAETMMNAIANSSQQSSNSLANFNGNVLGSIFGSVIDIGDLAVSAKKLYNKKDWIKGLEDNFKTQKIAQLIAEGKYTNIKDAQEAVFRMEPSEYLKRSDGTPVQLSEKVIDDVIEQKRLALEDKKNYSDGYKKQIAGYNKQLSQTTDTAKKIEIQSNIDTLQKELKEFEDGYNKGLASTITMKKLLKEGITDKNVGDFASIVKTAIDGAQNPEEFTDFLYRYAMNLPGDTGISARGAIVNATADIKRSKMIDDFDKTIGTPLKNYYETPEFNKLIAGINENADTYKWMLEKEGDNYKYWEKRADGYVLNIEGMRRMGIEDNNAMMELERTMPIAKGGEESKQFFDTIERDETKYGINANEIEEMKRVQAYNTLLDKINTFIPCID